MSRARLADVCALLFCASPLLAAVLLLARLVPPPLPPAAPPRTLVLTDGGAGPAAVRATAHRFPNAAALPAAALGAPLAYDSLPFDELRLAGLRLGAQAPALPSGWEPSGDAAARRRGRRWTALDAWTQWRPVASNDGRSFACTHRWRDGGFRCAKGPQVTPDVALVGGAWRGVVRVGRALPDTWLELPLPDAPARLAGTVWPDGADSAPLALELRRGDAVARTRCAGPCPVEVPAGDVTAPLVLRVVGPNPPLALELLEAR